MEEFYTTDDLVMGKLKLSNNNEVLELLNMLSKKIKFEVCEDNSEINIKKKFRYVDPEYLDRDKLCRLSDVDEDYKIFLEKQRKINERGIKVNLIKY